MTAPDPNGDMTFHALFDGHDERTFYTLQSAMAWAEGLGYNQTGTISFQGQSLVEYKDGDISATQPTG